jgi:hypothetical protein
VVRHASWEGEASREQGPLWPCRRPGSRPVVNLPDVEVDESLDTFASDALASWVAAVGLLTVLGFTLAFVLSTAK